MIERLVTRVDRHPGRVILLLGLLFAAAYAASLVLLPKPDGRIVIGDAVHYFVYLRSLAFDGDLHFQNEYMRIYGLVQPGPGTSWVFTPLPTGYVRNVMPIGSAIVWAPLYLVTWLGAWLASLAGVGGPVDGFSRPFQASTAFSGIAAATAGAWLAFLAARSMVRPSAALWATLGVWLGSSALYYSLVSPTYSHASSMLATSALVYGWWRTGGRTAPSRFALLGVLAGFAALVRWQDAVFLIAPLADAVRDAVRGDGLPRTRAARALVNTAVCIAAALVAFAPQMAVWWVLYGDPLLVPQGTGFMRWTEPHLVSVLFSSLRGLFTWTPVVAAAVAGLCLLPRDRRYPALVLSAILAVSWYTNAAVADWWAGEAFGARRFVSCFPIFVIGLAALLDRATAHARAVGLALSALIVGNLLLLFQYQLFLKGWRDVAPYPDAAWDLWVERFIVPIRVAGRLVRWWSS